MYHTSYGSSHIHSTNFSRASQEQPGPSTIAQSKRIFIRVRQAYTVMIECTGKPIEHTEMSESIESSRKWYGECD